MCVYVCVRVCVCVCLHVYVTSRYTGHTLSKVEKCQKEIVGFDICHRKASLRKFHSMTFSCFLKVTIWNVNVSEMVRASAKMHGTTFVEFDICRRMASMWKLYTMTMTYFLADNKLKSYYLWNTESLCKRMHWSTLKISFNNYHHYKSCIRVTLTYFFKVTILKYLYFRNIAWAKIKNYFKYLVFFNCFFLKRKPSLSCSCRFTNTCSEPPSSCSCSYYYSYVYIYIYICVCVCVFVCVCIVCVCVCVCECVCVCVCV